MNMLNLPKKVYFKPGSMNVALRELSEVYHLKRAFLVSDPVLYRSGAVRDIDDWLRKRGIRTAEFFSTGAPPSFAHIRSALPKLLEFEPDVIVGVGGGSAMSAAKAMWALYENPDLDLSAAAEQPERIRTGEKAKLTLVATSFAGGAQNSPFAVLQDDAGALRVLRSFQLLPEISVTDARFTETLSPAQVKSCGLAALSLSVRAFADPGCNEYTEHLLREAAGLILNHLPGGEAGRPDALEHLHNAAALVGAACGNVLETLDPAAPLWPAETDADGARIAVLARDLGFPDAGALRAACEALR